MGRIHLFEFEDQKWFPTAIRNYGTDFLQFLSNKTKLYKPVIPIIKKGLRELQTTTIIDLGSGGGGGLLWLNTELRKDIPGLKIVLTDYFPNTSAFKHTVEQANNFSFIATPVDAKNVPDDLIGLRTQFLSLHHFKPNDALMILQNAINSNNGIAVFEAQERSLQSFVAMLFSPISVLLTTPFIRPFKLGRIIFTYPIPIVPLFVLWDGLVSAIRTYSVKEMQELVNQLKDKEQFNWKIDKVKSGPGVVLYLLGTPKQN